MIRDKEKYLTHIKDSEQIIYMRKVLDKIDMVLRKHDIESTDFLDPYQVELSKSILNRFDVKYLVRGGYEGAERSVITIYPDYLQESEIESPIVLLQIKGMSKFNSIGHKDYLGAIMGAGIRREKVGDISVGETAGFIVLHREVLEYIKVNLTSIGRESVELIEVDSKDVIVPRQEYDVRTIVASSMRLDVLVSEVYGMSRAKSKSVISSDKVKVNWRPVVNPSQEICPGDMISVSKKGRFTVGEVLGETKKENIRLNIKIHL